MHLRHGLTQRRRKMVVVSVTISGRIEVALQTVEALGEEGGQMIDLVGQVGGHFRVGGVCCRRAESVVALRLVNQGQGWGENQG